MKNEAPGVSGTLLVSTGDCDQSISGTLAQEKVAPLLKGIIERDKQNEKDVSIIKECLTKAHRKNLRLELTVRVSNQLF